MWSSAAATDAQIQNCISWLQKCAEQRLLAWTNVVQRSVVLCHLGLVVDIKIRVPLFSGTARRPFSCGESHAERICSVRPKRRRKSSCRPDTCASNSAAVVSSEMWTRGVPNKGVSFLNAPPKFTKAQSYPAFSAVRISRSDTDSVPPKGYAIAHTGTPRAFSRSRRLSAISLHDDSAGNCESLGWLMVCDPISIPAASNCLISESVNSRKREAPSLKYRRLQSWGKPSFSRIARANPNRTWASRADMISTIPYQLEVLCRTLLSKLVLTGTPQNVPSKTPSGTFSKVK